MLTSGSREILAPFRKTPATLIGVEAGESWMRIAQHDPGADPAWAEIGIRQTSGSSTPEELGREIRYRCRHEGISPRPAVCALHSPAVDCFPLALSPKEGENLDDLVVAEVRERLSYPLEESVIDYTVLPDSVRKSADSPAALLVYTLHRSTAEDVIRRIEAGGLDLARLVTPACALASRMPDRGSGQRHVLVATSEGASSVSVAQDGFVLVERILPGGAEAMIASLRSQLRLSEEQCRGLLSPESPAPSDIGLPSQPAIVSTALRSALVEILGPVYRDLAQEAAGCLGYCDSFLKPKAPSSVVLVGLLSGNDTLRGVLSQALDATVMNAAEALDLPDWEEHAGVDTFAPAAACALWDEGEVA